MSKRGRAISPVISSIIIVAVAVVIALAAAAWFGGLFGTFTVVERLEVTEAFASGPTEITIRVKNTGSSPATIDNIYVNGKPRLGEYTIKEGATSIGSGYSKTLSPGDSVTYVITVPPALAGTSVSVGVHTASGNLITSLVRL